MMKKLMFTISLVSFFLPGIGQIQIKEGSYTTFNGRIIDVYKIEGIYTVLKIDTAYISNAKLKDTLTLSKILERIDNYYLSYKNLCGKEPAGGDPEFNFKSSVAFVGPSCGTACGWIGAKGIEASPVMFLQVFNEMRNQINTNRIGVVGYEFGRNFFTMGGKLLFPYTPNTDEMNGGFAEGFATLGYLLADLKYFSKQDSSLQYFQETIYFHTQLKRFFRSYFNDLKSNPFNSLAKAYQNNDINRNTWGYNIPAYYAAAILVGISDIFQQEDLFRLFFKNLEDRNNATTIEGALSNIAYSFSKALNNNLIPLFQNVLKFEIDQSTINSIQSLPLSQDKLIYDKDELWFTTPFDTIPLNIRSINYLNQKNFYQLFIDDSLVSENSDGNNSISYSMLKNKESANLTIKLLDSNKNFVDSQDIVLKKRTNINLSKYYRDFYFNNEDGYCKAEFKYGVYSLTNLAGKIAIPYLFMPCPLKRNRTIWMSAQIRNQRINYPDMKDSLGNYRIVSAAAAWIAGGGGSHGTGFVGTDIAINDSINYYTQEFTFNSKDFFKADWSLNLDFVSQSFQLFSVGLTNAHYKNIIFKDITDTDGDGIIDFEDPCPGVYGEDNGCPKITTIKNDEISSGFSSYPNPVFDNLNIQTAETGRISIFDIWGKLLLQMEVLKNDTQIDVSKFPKGTYLIHLKSDNRIETSKFLKL